MASYASFQTALAHLESLAIDVEQAHPPASKESIDCLPQIIITEDHNGKHKWDNSGQIVIKIMAACGFFLFSFASFSMAVSDLQLELEASFKSFMLRRLIFLIVPP